jgi:hypothetical protein
VLSCRIARDQNISVIAQFLKFNLIGATVCQKYHLRRFLIDYSFKSNSKGPKFDQVIQRYSIWFRAMWHIAEPWSHAMQNSTESFLALCCLIKHVYLSTNSITRYMNALRIALKETKNPRSRKSFKGQTHDKNDLNYHPKS